MLKIKIIKNNNKNNKKTYFGLNIKAKSEVSGVIGIFCSIGHSIMDHLSFQKINNYIKFIRKTWNLRTFKIWFLWNIKSVNKISTSTINSNLTINYNTWYIIEIP